MCTRSFETDEKIAEAADKLFADLGFDMSVAINMFLRKSVKEKGIPFEVRFEVPNKETRAAFEEAEKIANDIKTGKRKPYNTPDEMWKALNV